LKETVKASEDQEIYYHINPSRIQQNLKQLAAFGANLNGGIDRPFGSRADRQARDFLQTLWQKELGVATKNDAIANMWAIMPGGENIPPIVLGSHHDTVSNGGAYDGAMGVLLATEVMQTIKENGLQLRHPLAVISFTGEEPNPYGVSTLGSKTVSGKLDRDSLAKLVSKIDQSSLRDALAMVGGDLDQVEMSRLQLGEIGAFLECHIEQGRRLFDKHLPLAIVTQITGIYREKIRIVGEANHAGTTVMRGRKDALLAAADLDLSFEACINRLNREDVVGTIGTLEVYPNSANIIPGEVELILEFRTSEKAISQQIIQELDRIAQRITAERQVGLKREVILDQAAVAMDGQIMATLNQSLHDMKEPFLSLVSMAGHDAAHMVDLTKTGMLFVRSIDGKSHCAQEKTELKDIIKAGNVLLQTVIILDKELN
jgi:hydantoinase/carbamoylase family amidase